ncbi:hypothetical protein OQA88_9089 [Cercophora sp. LCS_1]
MRDFLFSRNSKKSSPLLRRRGTAAHDRGLSEDSAPTARGYSYLASAKATVSSQPSTSANGGQAAPTQLPSDDEFDRLTNYAFATRAWGAPADTPAEPLLKTPSNTLASSADNGSYHRRSSRDPSPLSDDGAYEPYARSGQTPSLNSRPASQSSQHQAPRQELHREASRRRLVRKPSQSQRVKEQAPEPPAKDTTQPDYVASRANRASDPQPRRTRSTTEFATNRISLADDIRPREPLPPLSNEGRARFIPNRANAELRASEWSDRQQQPLRDIPESRQESTYTPGQRAFSDRYEERGRELPGAKTPIWAKQSLSPIANPDEPNESLTRERTETARLNRELADKTREFERLRTEYRQLEQKQKTAEKKHQDSTEWGRNMAAKLEQERQGNDEQAKRINELEQALKQAKQSQTALNLRREEETKDYQQHIMELERRMKESKRDSENREAQRAKEVHDLKMKHQSELHEVVRHFEEMLSKQEVELADFRSKNDKLDGQSKDFDKRMGQLVADFDGKHKTELQAVKDEYDQQLGTLQEEHKTTTESLRARHQQEIENLKVQHNNEMAKYGRDWQQYCAEETAKLREKIRRQEVEHRHAMTTRSMAAGEIRPAGDDELKKMFNSLRLAIETVVYTATLPSNLDKGRVQPGGKLDLTGHLRRGGQLRCLLQNDVWEKVMRAFFSAPWGFGVLGPKEGFRMLMELYQAWSRVANFQGPGGADQDPGFERFKRDKAANMWRSATFRSLHSQMLEIRKKTESPEDSSDELAQPVQTLFESNSTALGNEICATLREVTNIELLEEMDNEVRRIASLAGKLAFEVGMHREYLALDFPTGGTEVTIGPDFVDWEDGDQYSGTVKVIDLVLCPRFFMVGDARGDVKTEKSIHPGEIYPRES